MMDGYKNKKGTVLLTGATGYVGSVVAEKLLARGWSVRGLTRSKDKALGLARRGIQPHIGDVGIQLDIMQACKGVDAVIHTATPGAPQPGKTIEETVVGAFRTLDLLRETTAAKGVRFLSMSGVSHYGDTGEKIAEETSPTQVPPFFVTYVEAEKRIIEASHGHILRSGVVYGRAGCVPVLQTLKAIANRGRSICVNQNNRLSVVHVDDLADLFILLLDADEPPSIVCGVADGLLHGEIMAAVGQASGVGEELDNVSAEDAMQLGGFGIYLPMNMHVSGRLARDTVGWMPSRMSFVEELKAGSYRLL